MVAPDGSFLVRLPMAGPFTGAPCAPYFQSVTEAHSALPRVNYMILNAEIPVGNAETKLFGSYGTSSWALGAGGGLDGGSVKKFEDAMALALQPVSAGNGDDRGPLPVSAVGQVASVSGPGPLDADQRVADGAGSMKSVSAAVQDEASVLGVDDKGSSILYGLSHLRGIFDQQISRIEELDSSDIITSSNLISAQVEIAQFSLLMDLTSKLTGKATQAVDTLMKGQ